MVKVKTITLRTMILIICIVMMENIFYLIDVSALNISGIFNYDIFWLALLAIFVGYNYLKYALWRKKVKCHFAKEFIFLVILVFVSVVQAQNLTGQPFVRGLMPQRSFLLIILCYFPLRKMYALNLINDYLIDKWLLILGIIAFLLYFTQSQLAGGIQFLYVSANERYGTARLYVDSIFCVMLGFYGMDKFLRGKSWKNLILVGLTVVYELFVSKGRLEFVAFAGTLIIGLTLMKRYQITKTIASISVVVLVLIFMNTQFSESIFEAITTIGSSTNTMRIRLYGRANYITQLTESWKTLIFGCGYPSSLWQAASIKAGMTEGVSLVDNGLYSFVYVYGLLGLFVVMFWFVKMLRMSIRLYVDHNIYIFLMFTIFQIALMYNITFWWWKYAWTIIIVIMMCKMEHYLYDIEDDLEGCASL